MLKKIIFSLMLVGAVSHASSVFAQVLDQGLQNTAELGAGYTNGNLEVTIGYVISILIGTLGIIFLLLTIYAGFTWMTAMGDSKKVETAKNTLSRAVIGLVIVLCAYAITSFIINLLTSPTSFDDFATSNEAYNCLVDNSCDN